MKPLFKHILVVTVHEAKFQRCVKYSGSLKVHSKLLFFILLHWRYSSASIAITHLSIIISLDFCMSKSKEFFLNPCLNSTSGRIQQSHALHIQSSQKTIQDGAWLRPNQVQTLVFQNLSSLQLFADKNCFISVRVCEKYESHTP